MHKSKAINSNHRGINKEVSEALNACETKQMIFWMHATGRVEICAGVMCHCNAYTILVL